MKEVHTEMSQRNSSLMSWSHINFVQDFEWVCDLRFLRPINITVKGFTDRKSGVRYTHQHQQHKSYAGKSLEGEQVQGWERRSFFFFFFNVLQLPLLPGILLYTFWYISPKMAVARIFFGNPTVPIFEAVKDPVTFFLKKLVYEYMSKDRQQHRVGISYPVIVVLACNWHTIFEGKKVSF